MSLGTRLRKCREVRGLSQAELARKMGIKNPSVIANWEIGNSHPDFDKITRLCIELSMSADYLLGLADENVIEDPAEEVKNTYRSLDERSQEVIMCVLMHERDRCKERDELAKRNNSKFENRINKYEISRKYLPSNHPQYHEMAENVKKLKKLRKQTGKGNDGLLYYLWGCRLSVEICMADIVLVLRGIKVPSPEFFHVLESYYLNSYEVTIL